MQGIDLITQMHAAVADRLVCTCMRCPHHISMTMIYRICICATARRCIFATALHSQQLCAWSTLINSPLVRTCTTATHIRAHIRSYARVHTHTNTHMLSLSLSLAHTHTNTHTPHTRATGHIMHERALQYRCRTKDPQRAHLFFVPAFSAHMANRRTEFCMEDTVDHERALYARLRAIVVTRDGVTSSALEARGGADHILVNPRNGADHEGAPTCELDYRDLRLGAATRFSVETPGPWKFDSNYRAGSHAYSSSSSYSA